MSRNSIFAGMIAFAVGTVLAVASRPTLAGYLAVVVGVETQVRLVEEPYLERTHGLAYRTYKADVSASLRRSGDGRAQRTATENHNSDV